MPELMSIKEEGRDWDRFWSLIQTAFPRAPAHSELSDRYQYFVLKDNEQILGTLMVDGIYEDEAGYNHVVIDSRWRGIGLGQQMVSEVNERLSSHFKRVVLVSSQENLPFYFKLGFEFDRLARPPIFRMYKNLQNPPASLFSRLKGFLKPLAL